VTWVLAGLVLLLLLAAAGQCRREIRAVRERVRRTAEVADAFGRARARWDRGTAAMEAQLAPLFDRRPGTGFGDSEVEAELLRRALGAPALVEMEER
jgi:hypothetical protein